MRFAFSLLLALSVAPAHAAEVVWNGVTITYDTDNWRVGTPSPKGGLAFTCIAADCKDAPTVYVTAASPLPAGAPAPSYPFCRVQPDTDAGRTQPLIDLSGGAYALPFAAVTRWSGCRALDQPILEACAESKDLLYRFTTRIANGCNFNPPVPPHHFQALLRGVRPTQ